jgi:hypothetical protein
MSLMPTFSRRKRQAVGTNDIYQYEDMPQRLRVQLAHIFADSIGNYYGHEFSPSNPAKTWDFLNKTMCKELGKFGLSTPHEMDDKQQDLLNWFLNTGNVDDAIDALELCLRAINIIARRNNSVALGTAEMEPDEAIEEANARMREAGFGFRFESNELIRIDSEFIHSETVVPALRLLADPKYAAAESEFRAAHEAYRHGRHEDCLIGCAKAFESVLKVIAKERRWAVKETDTAKTLLDAAFSSNFLLPAVQQGFSSLRSLLESGVPTPRNKIAGHGAGTTMRSVPSRLASFQLHQTAAAILFLAATHKEV